MTIKEAIKILHPESSFEALLGCTREEGLKIVEEACLIACEALEKMAGIERALERLEKECKESERKYQKAEHFVTISLFRKEFKTYENAVEIIKEEVNLRSEKET